MQFKNCDTTFSFNKASLADASIPPWTLKIKGESFYVNHVTSTATWSTKETPLNEHTKGSIKLRHVDITIDTYNCATITENTTPRK